jgi:hypothetical protein
MHLFGTSNLVTGGIHSENKSLQFVMNTPSPQIYMSAAYQDNGKEDGGMCAGSHAEGERWLLRDIDTH